MYAVRNNRLCTKDCLCIHVCPIGATDTEDGQIDRTKCIACGSCARSCPVAAISMTPDKKRIPPQQSNEEPVIESLLELVASKARQESIAYQLQKNNVSTFVPLAKALKQSNQIMAQGLLAEAGFMTPEEKNTQVFLQSLLVNPPPDFPVSAVKELLVSFKEK